MNCIEFGLFNFLYKKDANKCVTNPQIILDKPIKVIFNIIGLYKNDTPKPIQKEQHSGHKNGLLIYGILDKIFLGTLNISEKLHIYEKLKLSITKYNKL